MLQRCEAISQSLKSVLGGSVVTDRVSSLEAPPIVSHEALIEACGDAARYLKRCCKESHAKWFLRRFMLLYLLPEGI